MLCVLRFCALVVALTLPALAKRLHLYLLVLTLENARQCNWYLERLEHTELKQGFGR